MTQTVKQSNRGTRGADEARGSSQQLQKRSVVTEALLTDITRRIVQACDPERVILFGSYAYGTPTTDSDIDLFIVMNPSDAYETNHQRIMNARAAAMIRQLPMDIIVRTAQEVEARLALGDFFIKEIMDRGRVLFQRDTA